MNRKPNQAQRGGFREGSGRKCLPAGQARNSVFSVRVTDNEFALLKKTSAKTWAREVLVKAATKKVG
jgi:hypothetical protein